MKKLAVLAVLAASLVSGFAPFGAPVQAAEKPEAGSGKPLRGKVHPQRRGGYSYKYNQGIVTRSFTDPTLTSQTTAGPFDNGFFFSSPSAPHGGDSPYMQ